MGGWYYFSGFKHLPRSFNYHKSFVFFSFHSNYLYTSEIINLFVAEVYETKMSHKQYENEYKKGLLNKSEVVKHKNAMWWLGRYLENEHCLPTSSVL